jgi:hypothetical protein
MFATGVCEALPGRQACTALCTCSRADCVSAAETSIHLAAKQLIRDRKLFFFPTLVASVEEIDALEKVHRASKTIWCAACRELMTVEVEQSAASIRPDVLGEVAGLGRIAIEIAVTHFADEPKKAKLRELDLATVEVDLSGVRDATFEVLEALLLKDCSNRIWLHHPGLDGAEASLLEELEPALSEARVQALKAKRALEEKRLREHKQQSQAAHEWNFRHRQEVFHRRAAEAEQRRREEAQQRKTEQFFAAAENEKRNILLRWFGVDRLPRSSFAPMPWKNAFGVSDPHFWQTALFVGLIHRRPARGMFLLTFDTAFKWLRQRFESLFVNAEIDELALRAYFKVLSDEAGCYLGAKATSSRVSRT